MNKFSEIKISNIENENKFNTIFGIIGHALLDNGINAEFIGIETGIELIIHTDE